MTDSLKPSTIATIQELRSFKWFSRVGERHPEVSTAKVLSSWSEVVERLEDDQWENCCLDAANAYGEKLKQVAPTRFRSWNAKVEEIKVLSIPLVANVFSGDQSLRTLPKVVQDTVQWDVLHLCLEAEFSDCIPPGFYASNSYWYRVGHIPCGWNGNFPDGGIIIY